MRIVNLKNRAEWLEWRFKGIGASEAPAVMEASPFMTKQELWARKTERMLPQKSTPQMKRGLALESIARQEYERMTGIPMVATFVENDEHPFALSSTDGLNIEAGRVLEIKCPGKEDHATALKGEIPRKYIWQCVHLLLVTGLSQCDYFSFNGKEGVIVEFKKDLKMEEKLIKEERAFWEHVLKDTCPPKKLVSGIFTVRRSR